MPGFVCEHDTLMLDALERHRLYQHQTVRPEATLPSLVERTAQMLAEGLAKDVDAWPLDALPAHLQARIECYTPKSALMRPIRQVIDQGDFKVWPKALRAQHTATYVAGVTQDIRRRRWDASEHPDIAAVQTSLPYVLTRDLKASSPQLQLAQLDLMRIAQEHAAQACPNFIGLTPEPRRESGRRDAFFFTQTLKARGIRAHTRRANILVATLKHVWRRLLDEHHTARITPDASMQPYTQALCEAPFLAQYWDYDVLRDSVTSIDETHKRHASRDLGGLRRAVVSAASRLETPGDVRAQLIKLERHLSVFDVSAPPMRPRTQSANAPRALWHPWGPRPEPERWETCGVGFSFEEAAPLVAEAQSFVQRKRFIAQGTQTLIEPEALVALWTETQTLRSARPQAAVNR